jgi:hypothetical protein
MTSWSWPWTSPTMTTDWSGRGSTRTRLGSWWSPEAAVMTSRWTTGAGSTVGSWSAGRWREHQSRVEASPATQSRVSRPSSGHSTGRGRRGGSGGGSAAAAAPLGCDMACDGFDALGLDFSPLFAVLSLFLHFFLAANCTDGLRVPVGCCGSGGCLYFFPPPPAYFSLLWARVTKIGGPQKLGGGTSRRF